MKNAQARLPLALAMCAALVASLAAGCASRSGLRIEISFPASIHAEPVTGRFFFIIAKNGNTEPRFQAGSWTQRNPLFGADVSRLQPGQAAVIDSTTLGYPLVSLKDVPAGDYYVQALMNVYTEFHRSDSHTIWAHMDQWEGQHFARSPGNLYSDVQHVRLDPRGGTLKLSLAKVIPPIEVPPDTEWVKRIKIQSDLLTRFWGHPMYLGATILLPKGYDAHPNVSYPVLYEQGHFSLAAPFGFRTEPPPQRAEGAGRGGVGNAQAGYEFFQAWNSSNYPRMLIVTFQHPTPYFDDSYAVNSVNNGPYGDAIMNELIPYLETHFRIIRKPYARVLSGGSTGGWESLALQVLHPEFFGGTWTFFPDPVDFRRYQLVDVYHDDNAFYMPGYEYEVPVRPLERSPEGQVLVTMKEDSQLEAVLGSHGRSGSQLDIWQAAYGPVGDDGYPKPIWDKMTGKIDHDVALYMRDHDYDLTYYLQKNWPKLGPHLVGKIHVYCGDMDSYYLNLAVYMLEDFLKDTRNPAYEGSFEYGRPMKPHGWHPMPYQDLIRMMADHITKHAPEGERTSSWNYN